MCRIFVTGDKHGNPQEYKSAVDRIEDPKETDKIIVCGDAGLSYDT